MDVEINETVEVGVVFRGYKAIPRFFRWRGRTIRIQQVTLVHKVMIGHVPWHFFSVMSDGNLYRLAFEPQSFTWRLDQVQPLGTE